MLLEPLSIREFEFSLAKQFSSSDSISRTPTPQSYISSKVISLLFMVTFVKDPLTGDTYLARFLFMYKEDCELKLKIFYA